MWQACARLFFVTLLLAGSGCVSTLAGIGVYGAVKDAQEWERIPCGWQRNSPYSGEEVCARVQHGAGVFGVQASPVMVDWVESNCPPPKDGIACVVDPWGRTVADYRDPKGVYVMAIHPDPAAPICKTAVAHAPVHVFLIEDGQDDDFPEHSRRLEWQQVNGCGKDNA